MRSESTTRPDSGVCSRGFASAKEEETDESDQPKVEIIGPPKVCSYYKDATYRKVIGARGTGCCGEPISWGSTSIYVKCQTVYCLDVLCPDDQI